MQAWHIWIILGIAFFIIEIFTPAFFFASLGVGAFAAAIAAFYPVSFTLQIVCLTLGTFVVFLGIRPLINQLQRTRSDQRKIGIQALVGETALVIETIDPSGHSGRVKLKGEDWKAAAVDGDMIADGSRVAVEKIEGVTAYVRRL